MPVKELTARPGADAGLIDALAEEWEQQAGGPDAPHVFLFKDTGSFQPIEVYVAWDEWADLDQESRSGIIMAAYERVSPDEAVRVTVAMGLTVAEAKSKGLPVSE